MTLQFFPQSSPPNPASRPTTSFPSSVSHKTETCCGKRSANGSCQRLWILAGSKQGLCVDALIDISDDDSDWELNLKEFRHCLEPGFLPPQKKCSLEEEQYDDGAETQVNCNSCVCACGNWVCTALKCDPTQAPPTVGPSKKDDLLEKSPEELLEEEWDEYVKLLGDNGPKAPSQEEDHASQEEEDEDWSIEDDMDEIFPRKKHRKHKKGIKLIKEKVRFD
ncbi:FSTL1 [Branchiostoma lanceolatum]|uniref:FSTL1 protein n=1 Tax=Branchiostoma lanceolatum TaxID=7740 RepID=A0A8S4MNI6_BRALA|nr:FSTL1 [Branchiostoma lanceolatum]